MQKQWHKNCWNAIRRRPRRIAFQTRKKKSIKSNRTKESACRRFSCTIYHFYWRTIERLCHRTSFAVHCPVSVISIHRYSMRILSALSRNDLFVRKPEKEIHLFCQFSVYVFGHVCWRWRYLFRFVMDLGEVLPIAQLDVLSAAVFAINKLRMRHRLKSDIMSTR